MPKVSIVLPTRERPDLLKFALASALKQDYEDFEIVVSDNYSGSQTRQVVESFQSPRVRYFRTKEPLSMPDSWEFALKYAKGEYITFLTDDSYMLPDAISCAMAYLGTSGKRIAVWSLCTYFSPDWIELERRNVLYISDSSFQPRLLQSADSLATLFDLQSAGRVPKLLNCLAHRELVEKATEVQGRFFLPPAPDYAGAVGLLQQTEEYIFLDWPLCINGVFPQSIGASQRFSGGKASKDFVAEFKEKNEVSGLIGPDIHVPAVIIAQTLETMRKFYPTMAYQINQKRLISDIINDLVVHESNGADVGQEWRTLQVYLKNNPVLSTHMVRRLKIYSRLRLILKKVRQLPFWEYFEQLRGIHVYSGDRNGFSNIQECGEVAVELISKMRKGRTKVLSDRNHKFPRR